MKKINYLKAGALLAMAVYGVVCAADATEPGVLDRVDLVIHEAGHLFFSWFGELPQVLGGTIGQLFVPAAFTAYFHLRREFVSSAVAFFWCGQNLLNISVYIRDAQAMALPLVSVGGGEDAIHDWNYLLSGSGSLRWDQAIGSAVYMLGIGVMLASVLWGIMHSIEEQPEDVEAIREGH